MSYTEAHTLLTLGKSLDEPKRFSADDCTNEIVARSETQLMRLVTFASGVNLLFWFDRITDQCRVFADVELGVVDGKLVIVDGIEIGPGEWN